MSSVRTDETVTAIRVLASQGAINFDTDTLEGFEGTIADVFSRHGLGTREALVEDSVLIDHAGEFVSGLAVIFPNLTTVTISRSMSSAEGGGRYDWRTFRRKPRTEKIG